MPTDKVPSEEQTASQPALAIQVSAAGGGRTIHLMGELDMTTVPELDAVIRGVVLDASEIVIDLDGVTFIDSSGLRCILECQDLCKRFHTNFLLTPGNWRVMRLFEITGILGRLPFVAAAA